ncbi:MAG: cache domain-containing protein, partial [Candidatus Omnitrophota bacterium]
MKGKVRKKVIIPIIVSQAALLGILAFSIYVREANQLTGEVEQRINSVYKLFRNRLEGDAEMLRGLVDFLEEEAGFRESWQSRDRDALLGKAAPMFEELKAKYKVTHFYFIEPDGVCFLRVHNPDRYGDKIERFTLRGAIETGDTTYGIELGPFGTFTLRRVYPWKIQGNLAGYIELGEEVEHITPQLKDVLGVDLLFTIDKKYLARDEWEKGVAMTGKRANWQWDMFPSFVIIDSTLKSIPKGLIGIFAKSKKNTDNTLFRITAGRKVYMGGTIDLYDAG